MKKLALTLIVMVAVVTVSTLHHVAQAQPVGSASAEDERNRLFKEGVDLAAKGKWQAALVRFQRVVEIRATAKALYTLAEAEEKVGRLATAMRTFGRARKMALDGGEAGVAEASAAAVLALDARVPRVRIRTKGTVAEVTVDGKAAPADEEFLELDPGGHELHVKLVEGTERSETLALVPSDRLEFVVDPPATPDAEGEPSIVGPVTLGALGLVAGLVGVGLYVQGNAAYDEACGSQHRCPSEDAADTGNAARTRMIAGDVLMGAGFAGAGAGAIWLGVELSMVPTSPTKGTTGGGFVVGGRF